MKGDNAATRRTPEQIYNRSQTMPSAPAVRQEHSIPEPSGTQQRRVSVTFQGKPFLKFLAVIFAVATIVYSFAWMYYVRLEPTVELQFEVNDTPGGKAVEVTSVKPGGPADKAGLKPGDLIVAINGQQFKPGGPNLFGAVWAHGRPGETVTLEVERPSEGSKFHTQAVFRRSAEAPSLAKSLTIQIVFSYPLVFLFVGLAVLFMRVEDPNAWLLALLFASFIAVSGIPGSFSLVGHAFLVFLLAYRAVLLALLGPLFLFFFSVFPSPSPVDRRVPWLKWLALGAGLYIGLLGMSAGEMAIPGFLASALGPQKGRIAILIFVYTTILLGFVSLVASAVSAPDAQSKRKIRVILWGTFIGLTPAIAVRIAPDFFHRPVPFWENAVAIVSLSLFPLSFAYAVVKHQVLEIPALLKRSARYVLVKRGVVVLLVLLAISVNMLLGMGLSRMFEMKEGLAMSIGGGLGIALAWISARGVRRTTQRIDRAFFREAYDARIILQELARKVRSVGSREELAELIKNQLELALHPASLTVYVRSQEGVLTAASAMTASPRLSPESPGLRELARVGEAVESSTSANLLLLVPELSTFHPECLVPVPGRSGDLMGLFVLGGKLSEEPYSREDKQLLGSVASQAGLALDSISMAEEMAKRMEADLRAQQEMQIARAVQSKLLPQQCPPLATLEYAGTCIQARAVGGDYYDFLEVGEGRVGFVLADIAGKGISGALLMANLQASLRSMYAAADRDLPQLLGSVNHLFVKNTETTHYATMFFGLYDDASRKMLYANCGHNPPILLRRTGEVERLEATATVLGLFEPWECSVAETGFCSGDILVIYTDGITEAANRNEEEFGEERLLSLLRMNKGLNASDLMKKVLRAVQEFSPGEQGDDLTLIVAIAR